MKTKKQVIADNEEFKTLINGVITKIGMDSIEYVNSHGMSAGFGGLIYYCDTHQFAIKNRKSIIALLERDASDFGKEVVEMVAGFGQFRQNKMDNDDRKDLYKFLGGGKCEQSTITNLMAWYAAETVCRWFEE
jgi:hypothetical protein